MEAVISNGLVEKYKVFSAESVADEKRAIGALGQDSLTKVECSLLRQIIGELQLSCYCEWYYGLSGVYSITLKKINLHSFTARKLINVLAEVNGSKNNSQLI